jgi:predicted MFS family arabinose efflux permease
MTTSRPIAREIASGGTVAEQGLSRGLVLLLAIAVGATVANRYYIEPLLNLIARTFHASETATGLLVTFAQVGYVVGLALVVPLGDLFDRRKLGTIMLLGAALAAIGCAAARDLPALAISLSTLGLFAAIAQMLIPLAAALARPEEKESVVGIVSSGLVIGMLLARTISGLAAGFGGFRLIFAIAAIVMVMLSYLLWRTLPRIAPPEKRTYLSLLGSTFALVVEERVLRHRMAIACLQMAGFMVLWTPMAFLLGGPPYHYDVTIIGLFGLVGVCGAIMAPIAGRMGDRGYGRLAVTAALLTILASWGLLAMGRTSLIALIAGVALLDLGFQAAHINHQRAIYSLREGAHSRLNTAYMVAFFFGGVGGAVLAAMVYGEGGWVADCALGGALAFAALAVWLLGNEALSRKSRSQPPDGKGRKWSISISP